MSVEQAVEHIKYYIESDMFPGEEIWIKEDNYTIYFWVFSIVEDNTVYITSGIYNHENCENVDNFNLNQEYETKVHYPDNTDEFLTNLVNKYSAEGYRCMSMLL